MAVILAGAVALTLLLVSGVNALALGPAKGATYIGIVGAGSQHARIRLEVSKDGKAVVARAAFPPVSCPGKVRVRSQRSSVGHISKRGVFRVTITYLARGPGSNPAATLYLEGDFSGPHAGRFVSGIARTRVRGRARCYLASTFGVGVTR